MEKVLRKSAQGKEDFPLVLRNFHVLIFVLQENICRISD